MNVKHIYTEDLEIAKALIRRDEAMTIHYFYEQCYPLFKSIYDNFETDCMSYKEFIHDIYLVVLAPSKTTGKCQMENFKGESTLTNWLKSACLFYCYKKYGIKKKMPKYEPLSISENNDRIESIYGSIEIDFSILNREDALILIEQMPNKRYGELIRLRYLDSMTNEETAKALDVTIDNYYNMHKRAKEQYYQIQRKEACYE